jgi:hypothetical protein
MSILSANVMLSYNAVPLVSLLSAVPLVLKSLQTSGIYFPENTIGSLVSFSRSVLLVQVALLVIGVSSAHVFGT